MMRLVVSVCVLALLSSHTHSPQHKKPTRHRRGNNHRAHTQLAARIAVSNLHKNTLKSFTET